MQEEGAWTFRNVSRGDHVGLPLPIRLTGIALIGLCEEILEYL